MGKLGTWIQVISNFAVLIGLVFVGVQLYQDRELKRIELLDQGWEMDLERLRQIMGEDIGEIIAKSAMQPGELTDGEQYRLIIYFDTVLAQRRRNTMLERVGMRPESWTRLDLPGAFQTEAGKTYIERILRNPEPDSADWALPDQIRDVWSRQIQEESFTLGLRSLIEGARKHDKGSPPGAYGDVKSDA